MRFVFEHTDSWPQGGQKGKKKKIKEEVAFVVCRSEFGVHCLALPVDFSRLLNLLGGLSRPPLDSGFLKGIGSGFLPVAVQPIFSNFVNSVSLALYQEH